MDRFVMVYREQDPQPGQVIKGIYPSANGLLPQMSTVLPIHNVWTLWFGECIVCAINRTLHTYDIMIDKEKNDG